MVLHDLDVLVRLVALALLGGALAAAAAAQLDQGRLLLRGLLLQVRREEAEAEHAGGRLLLPGQPLRPALGLELLLLLMQFRGELLELQRGGGVGLGGRGCGEGQARLLVG